MARPVPKKEEENAADAPKEGDTEMKDEQAPKEEEGK